MAQRVPPPPPGQPAPPGPAGRADPFIDFRRRRWWELVLIFLPITLIPIGGLLGGATGGAGLALNAYIAKQNLSTFTRVAVMIGVVLASYVVFFILEVLFYLLTHR